MQNFSVSACVSVYFDDQSGPGLLVHQGGQRAVVGVWEGENV